MEDLGFRVSAFKTSEVNAHYFSIPHRAVPLQPVTVFGYFSPMNHTAAYFVEKLKMQLHPEGGWFKETYRSEEVELGEHLPNRFGHARHFSTAIYFLLEGKQFSAFHRIKSDEMWHFYYGGPLHVYVINKEDQLHLIKLGNNPEAGEEF